MIFSEPVAYDETITTTTDLVQSKPEGKTARLIRERKELWRWVVGCARHPRVENAVLSEDSLFSQVGGCLSQARCTMVFQTCRCIPDLPPAHGIFRDKKRDKNISAAVDTVPP